MNKENKSRVLKPQRQRKPEEIIRYADIVNGIIKQTDFRKVDVKKVLDAFMAEVYKGLMQKKQVKLHPLGIVYPAIKRSRVGMNMIGEPTPIIVPDRWMLRFQPSQGAERKIGKLPVSQEELNNMYKE